MEINGRLLQARVLLHDWQFKELTEVTVVENVRLVETQTALPDEKPLLITGQWLWAAEANSPRAKVTVIGEPAHMEGRGMGLTGPNIHIDRGTNVLSMEGAGQMDKVLDRDLENRPLSRPGAMQIVWQKGMTFDGRKAHFHDSVSVNGNLNGSPLEMHSGWLDVCFQRRSAFPASRSSRSRPWKPWPAATASSSRAARSRTGNWSLSTACS